MEIKTPTIDDAQAISQLLEETFKKVNIKDYPLTKIATWIKFANPEEIKKRLTNREIRNFIAVKNDQIVGYLALAPQQNLLLSLYVKSDQIGQGIGSELLSLAEAILENRGQETIELQASKTAVNFYTHKGYKKVRAEKLSLDGQTIAVTRMTKKLQPKASLSALF